MKFTNIKSLLAVALGAVGLSAAAGLAPVEYLDWDDVGKEMTNAVCTAYTVVTADMAAFDAGKTYVVMDDVSVSSCITVNGTAANPTRLILCDGTKLTASAGVKVTVSGATTNALVICGQTLGTGALEATGGLRTAGIGGLSNDTPGESGTGGTVTINGGTVTATGGICGAGIGGGWGGHGGTVTINGGTVTAKGVQYGAGIGGGLYGAGGTVTINGGTVTATAGTDGGEAPTVAIGCCQESGDNGTVTFGAGNWIVKAGNAAPGADVTAEEYAANHSAKYVHIEPPPEISAESAEGFLDLTVGDRVAKDVEPLVIDPAWDETDPSLAKVFIDGEEEPRQYTVATNDTWETAALEPGRYELEMQTSCSSYPANFWKLGDDWVVFDSSNITADVTFEAGKTYLFFGTNTVAGTLTVQDGAKFEYGEGAPAGFQTAGGSLDELPKRYTIADGLDPADERNLYQIVEKIKGCEDNPWDIGEGVTAYTNGTELVIGGEGTIADLSEISDEVKGEVASLTIATNGVTGVASEAFQGFGENGMVALTLPDGWDGELPDDDGNWYGATGVTLTAMPLAVKNVKFLQRYPWNGKVDIGFGVTGPEGEKTAIVTVRDGATEVTNFTAAVTIPASGVLATNLVWDAAGLAANFKSDDVTVEVAFAGGLPAGQLWENGPIWAECNVGDGATVPGDYGALYTFEGDKAKAAAEGLGDGWRLPSYDELDKLDGCTKSWETCKDSTGADRAGYRFTGTGDYSSNSIFLPAAGYNSEDGREYVGSYGYYWSSEVANDGDAFHLYFWDGQVSVNATHVSYGMPVRAVRNASAASSASAISAKSAVGTVDLRTNVAFAEGETTISNVTWSATLWGELDEEFVTAIGWTNLTTGATGVFSNLARVVGDAAEDVDLPTKDGDYRLTHSTGDLTSFVTFVVSGYPLGSEGNPWLVGSPDPEDTVAWTDGTGTVFFKPARSAVTKEGLETVTNAMGGASFLVKLISEDGSATNDLVMVLGESGTVYDTIAEALYADEASYTLFEVGGYFVSYDGGEGASGTMATDKFIPTVPTNLTANAYTIVGYAFTGWSTDGVNKAYDDCAAGVDFVQPGETLSLTALWEQVETVPANYDDLTNMLAKVTRPVAITLDEDIEIPAGGKIEIPAGKDVTFAGEGKFDVTAERPALFCGYPVGTGLKPEDLGRFVTDEDVRAYFEDGKVVVRGRGETEDFPWLIGTDGHEDEVTAWAIDGGILAKPARGTASVAALQSVTNALSGYVPGPGELKVISADGSATNDVVALVGDDGMLYDTLADVFAADPMPTTVRLYEVSGQTISLPAGIAGEAFVVSNLTTGAEITPSSTVPGGAEYTLPLGAKVAVYAVPSDGYRLLDDGTNPIVIDEVTTETTVDVSEIPTVKSLAEESAIGDSDTTWRIENGVLYIEGEGEMPDFDEANPAPWDEFADEIASVEIGDEVTKLGDLAFGSCDNVAEVVLASDATPVNPAAFSADGETVENEPKLFVRNAEGGLDAVLEYRDPDDDTTVYESLDDALDDGAKAVEVVTLPKAKAEAIAALTDYAGEDPSEAVQQLLAEAAAAIEAAETLDAVGDAAEAGYLGILTQLAKEKPQPIAGSDLTWQLVDGELVIEGEGAMPDFDDDGGDGAPWEALSDLVKSVKTGAGVASLGNEAFALCENLESMQLGDAAMPVNLKAFIGEYYDDDLGKDVAMTNLPATVTAFTGRAEVTPVAWLGDDGVEYATLADALAAGCASVTAVLPEPEFFLLYPDGDGGVFVPATKSSEKFDGVLLGETGVEGTIQLKLKKPNKRTGLFDIQAKVRTLVDKASYTFKAKKVSAPAEGVLTVTLEGSGKKAAAHTLVVTLDGDSLTGSFDGFALDGARDVFALKGNAKRKALDPYVATWTGAFAVPLATMEDVTYVLDATFSAKVKASGKAVVKVIDADGRMTSCSTKAEVGADGRIAVPVTVWRSVKGAKRSFGFRFVFDADCAKAVDVSPFRDWSKKSGEAAVYATVEFVAADRLSVKPSEFKSGYVIGLDPEAEALLGPVAKNGMKLDSYGLLRGTLKWNVVYTDARGREKRKSVSGNAAGVMIKESGIGKVNVKIDGEERVYPFSAVPTGFMTDGTGTGAPETPAQMFFKLRLR